MRKLKLKDIALIGVLIALSCVLSYCEIRFTQSLKITFSFLPLAMIGASYGGMVGGVCGVLIDTLKYLVNPDGPYCPLFAINEFLMGYLYGKFFYKRKLSWKACLIVQLIINVALNIFLNPLWLNILYGGGYWYYVSLRVVKNIILYPLEVFLLYFGIKELNRVRQKI